MNKGFSLVELIVVIAIMAILVGVAVPVYTSYITKANEAVDIQAVDNLKHACEIVAAEYGITITYECDAEFGTIEAVIDEDETDAIAQLNLILGTNGTTVTLKGEYADVAEIKTDLGIDVTVANANPEG